MKNILRILYLLFLIYLNTTNIVLANAGLTKNDWQTHRWNARWITIPGECVRDYGVYHFRKQIELSAVTGSFIVHVSADQRYILYVNGHQVSKGPARGDLLHWAYESVDIASYLQKGKNVIGATVWNYGEWSPGAQTTLYTGFIIQGNSRQEELVNSDASWKVVRDKAYAPSLDYLEDVGPGDNICGELYPWGWDSIDYNDSEWKNAEIKEYGQPYGTGTQYLRALTPRTIPPMEEKIEVPLTVRKCDNLPMKDYFKEEEPIMIGSHTHTTILFDQGYLTNAYPLWRVSGGAGAMMKVTYAESLYQDAGNKGNRNEIEGKFIKGFVDRFYFEGGDNRSYVPLWFRTFRYIELEVQTSENPLIIHSFTGKFTGYPFEEKASFICDREVVNRIWKTGWRTARLCAGETYYDCPYYEQLQYGGDTRIQALISLYVSGDDRLVRKAIADLASSRISSGLLYSRYPSRYAQIIPPFSLYWINMLHDYCMLRPDSAFVASYIPVMKGILDWYISRVDRDTGMLGQLPHWNFIDWTEEWPWSDKSPIGGVPPGGISGGSSILSFQLAYALSDAMELMQFFGEDDFAEKYERVKNILCDSTLSRCYNSQCGLIADDDKYTSFSQHASIMSILSGAVSGEKARQMIVKILSDKSLIQATVYYRFYLFKAMKKCGMADIYIDNLSIWKDMLENGLSTFAEKPEPSRSDCHAWSASPTYDLLATVCGIEPASWGFKTVKISPHLGSLKSIKGRVPHQKGVIMVDLKLVNQSLQGVIYLPDGVTGVFIYKDVKRSLTAGINKI